MSSLDDIYKLRPVLEEAIRATFEAMSFVALTRLNAPEKFQQATPRVEIKCRIGAATGRRHIFTDGSMKFDAWRFQAAFQAVTIPVSTESGNSTHEDYVARIRAECSSLAQASWSDTQKFPTILIAEPLQDSGTESNLKTDEGSEVSVLTYDGIVCIRTDAWNN